MRCPRTPDATNPQPERLNIPPFYPMSYHKLIYHIVFGTKYRQQTITVSHDRELYKYIFGIINNLGGFVLRINGMPDHIHILTTLPPKISVSDAVKAIKQSSSIWLNTNPNFPKWLGWGNGYAVISYSESEVESVKNYIINQKTHHASIGFAEEYEHLVKSIGYENVYDD